MVELRHNAKEELNRIKECLIDPLAIELTNSVNWLKIKELSRDESDLYPITIIGDGKPVILLHGFDSCFMEFRRLSPHLKGKYKLIIPDLFGFGFCPRPKEISYGINSIIYHLEKTLETLNINSSIGLIGASMGGGIAMKFARSTKFNIQRILLLSPAGLIGKPTPIPPPFNTLGACFLKQPFVREGLCKQSFANPKDVGEQEKQIASIHLNVPGWSRSLAAFARDGGVANCALPLPKQPLNIIWGKDDRILNQKLRAECIELVKCEHEEIDNCGHLPHIDKPELVAKRWDLISNL